MGTKAITKRAVPSDIIQTTTKALTSALSQVALAIQENTPPEAVATIYEGLSNWGGALERVQKMVKERLLTLAVSQGRVATEKGTRRLQVGGWELEARVHRSGLDPKRVEGLLRAKGLPVEQYMDPTISYKVNENRLEGGVNLGKLTADEVESCRYELNYTLQPLKKVEIEE